MQNLKSLASAILKIWGGSQNLIIGHVTPPRHSVTYFCTFLLGPQPSMCMQNFKFLTSVIPEICIGSPIGIIFPNSPPYMAIGTPSWYNIPWAPRSLHPKWHLDLFSHYCTVKPSWAVWQTDRQTPWLPVTIVCILCMWCSVMIPTSFDVIIWFVFPKIVGLSSHLSYFFKKILAIMYSDCMSQCTVVSVCLPCLVQVLCRRSWGTNHW